MKETFGQRLARLRKEAGLTQAKLAAIMGVTVQAVWFWENDNRVPDIASIPLLAKTLGVSTDILLGNEEGIVKMEQKNENIDDLLVRMRVLSADGDVVKMNLPLSAINLLKDGDDDTKVSDEQLNKVLQMVKSGCRGDILKVVSSDGTIVSFWVGSKDDNYADDDFFKARTKEERNAKANNIPEIDVKTVDPSTDEKKEAVEKEKTNSDPVTEDTISDRIAAIKDSLNKRLNQIVEEMKKPDSDIASLAQELKDISLKLKGIDSLEDKVSDLIDEREDKEDDLEDYVDSIRSGDGDPVELSEKIKDVQLRIREIDKEMGQILAEYRVTDPDEDKNK